MTTTKEFTITQREGLTPLIKLNSITRDGENIIAKEFVRDMTDLPIAEFKKIKKAEIDAKTGAIIFRGFAYGGLTWSLSITAQINWSNIPNLPITEFPKSLQSQEDEIMVLTYLNRMEFYMASVSSKIGSLTAGSVLKMQVEALTTIEDVINFVDART